MERKFDLGSIMLFVGVLVLLAAQVLWLTPTVPTIAYSDFQRLLAAHEVDNLVVTPTRISGELRSEEAKATLPASDAAAFTANKAPYPFTTIRVADESLPARLTAAGVHYRGALDSNWSDMVLAWIAPLVLFVIVWQFLMRRGGGGARLHEHRQKPCTHLPAAGHRHDVQRHCRHRRSQKGASADRLFSLSS